MPPPEERSRPSPKAEPSEKSRSIGKAQPVRMRGAGEIISKLCLDELVSVPEEGSGALGRRY